VLTATDRVRRYSCVDAVARSTYLCEYYLRFRKLLEQDGGRAAVIPLDELAASLTPGSVDLAVNVHGFSEMSYDAIAAWLQLVADLKVPSLFVVPNEPHMLSREGSRERREYRGLIEAAGYRLEVTEPAIRDLDVRNLFGAHDHFFLFNRA